MMSRPVQVSHVLTSRVRVTWCHRVHHDLPQKHNGEPTCIVPYSLSTFVDRVLMSTH